MECRACGATLREGARFCNKCGAGQDDALAEDQQETSAAIADDDALAGGGNAGSSGRARRPPRVPRATDGADASSSSRTQTVPVATDILDAAVNATQNQQSTQASAPVPPDAEADTDELAEPEMTDLDAPEAVSEAAASDALIPDVPQSPVEPAATDATPEVPVASSASTDAESPQPAPLAPSASVASASPEATLAEAGADSAAPTWEDADTIEYSVVLQRGQSLDTVPVAPQPTDMPSLDELPHPSYGDALPWPLPQSIIVGGRYRVEEALTTAPDAPGAENVYRVRDLQGYEQCWSCGAAHGADAAPDRFCQECGADMLSRDYLMYECRQESESAETPDAGAADAEANAEPGEQGVRIFTQGARVYRVQPRAEEPPLFPRGVRVVAAMATDTGASRAGEENEDSAGVLTLSVAHDSRIEPLTLCVVADGLGGHASGQEASRLAVRILAEHILRTVALPNVSASAGAGEDIASLEASLVAALKDGVEAANKAICARNKSTRADMGSTCVAVLVHRDTAYFVNVGDSRGYILDDGELRRITTDHSLVEQLIAGGLIPPEERYTHPQRNQIFRSLGDEPKIALDTFTQQLRPGMRLLLCSDGLWEMVRDDEMARILRETANPQQACDLLVSAANDHGGEDNISAVVVDISA